MTNNIIDYRPARYCDGKDSHISYYVRHPQTRKMVRVKIRLNSEKRSKERRKWANRIMQSVNKKLHAGWNPFIDADSPRSFDSLLGAAEKYLDEKSKVLRPNSMKSYKSHIGFLIRWMTDHGRQDDFVISFVDIDAVRIMERVSQVHAKSPATYNSYLESLRKFWNWLIEHCYTKNNPFLNVKKRAQNPKGRDPIPTEERERIEVYLRKNHPRFLVACQLVYYCLLRPNEITWLTSDLFDLKSQTILIPGHANKNKKDQLVTIPDVLVDDLSSILADARLKPGVFIFSDQRKFTPGSKRMDPRYFTKAWTKMRDELQLSKRYQMYSLKDTGIIDLLAAGVPNNEIMHQARHHSLEMTTIYIKHLRTTASPFIKQAGSSF